MYIKKYIEIFNVKYMQYIMYNVHIIFDLYNKY